MKAALALLLLLTAAQAHALTAEGKEFVEITRELEPVQCEKRRLRREMAMAQVEGKSLAPFQKRFAELNRDPKTAKLEKRLAALEPRVKNNPDDLAAISRQQREAFYRCE